MYDQTDLDRLVEAMRATGVTLLEVKTEADELRLVLPPVVLARTEAHQQRSTRHEAVRSPGIGTFLPRGMDDGLPTLAHGATVLNGDVLGYLCLDLARAPIVAPVAGTLSGDIPEEGTMLGYGDTVFVLETLT